MQTTDWKEKAMFRSVENKRLNKRIRELLKSRDDWKAKSVSHKKRADALELELKKIRIKLNDIIQ